MVLIPVIRTRTPAFKDQTQLAPIRLPSCGSTARAGSSREPRLAWQGVTAWEIGIGKKTAVLEPLWPVNSLTRVGDCVGRELTRFRVYRNSQSGERCRTAQQPDGTPRRSPSQRGHRGLFIGLRALAASRNDEEAVGRRTAPTAGDAAVRRHSSAACLKLAEL
jgi:hypothetical protein